VGVFVAVLVGDAVTVGVAVGVLVGVHSSSLSLPPAPLPK
jgi:hypothetical protein